MTLAPSTPGRFATPHPWLAWPEDDDEPEDVAVAEHWRAAEIAEAQVELAGIVRRARVHGIRAQDRLRWAMRVAAGEEMQDLAAEAGLSAGYVASQVQWAMRSLAFAAVDADAWRAYEDSWARWRAMQMPKGACHGWFGPAPASPVPDVPRRWMAT